MKAANFLACALALVISLPALARADDDDGDQNAIKRCLAQWKSPRSCS